MENQKLIATLNWRGIYLSSTEYHLFCELAEREGLQNITGLLEPSLQRRLGDAGNWVEQGRRDLEDCDEGGFNTVTYGDASYPKAFLGLAHPPLILTYQGSFDVNHNDLLCVLGSRKLLSCTDQWMNQHLNTFLSQNKLKVVSGGAYGVDQCAHRIALRTGCPTLCFLPSGLSRLYPKALYRWRDAILDGGGAMVSQFAPRGQLFKSNFHLRNELMVHLSQLIFVAQAALRSGSMMSAKFAIHHQKPLVTLPFTSSQSEGSGSLELIANGCPFIRSALELKQFWESSLGASVFKLVDSKP